MVAAMSEGLILPPVPRGTLLSPADRAARLAEAVPQIRAALAGETDAVAIQATLAALLWEALPHASFCGFYRRVDDRTLVVGPYQGPMACLRIDVGRGVCGACARSREVQLVPDISLAPDHIACDARTRSELVVPVVASGDLRAVLDLDSHDPDAFSREEADRLLALVTEAFADARF